MKLFYFVGGPVDGHHDAFFKRLSEVGGPPAGWRLYPHVDQAWQALHIVEATGEDAIEAHLAQFGAIYRHGRIVEVVPPRSGRRRQPGSDGSQPRPLHLTARPEEARRHDSGTTTPER